MVDLQIYSSKGVVRPAVLENVVVEQSLEGAPSRLHFSMIAGLDTPVEEGHVVTLHVDRVPLFRGVVFMVERNEQHVVSVSSYDSLRYLKSKDTYVYEQKKASDLVRMLASDFGLQVGTVEDTGFTIAYRVEDQKSLMDILRQALTLTFEHTGKKFVLFDDFGKLSLRGLDSLKLGVVIDGKAGQGYLWSSDIDNSFNKVKLVFENRKKGLREVFVAQDAQNIQKWGTLQQFGRLTEPENGQAKANAMLEVSNRKSVSLTVRGVFGVPQVRPGCTVMVQLGGINGQMFVEKARHCMQDGLYTMELLLREAL